ncbi:MAG TPA: tetratricopeptide repeat protein [Gemmatimonadales bacterium]|jgi:predicted Zn-dependent protease|nr:tetratricopeptide repeat protein [Gemmatimonadales bacterium]
MLVVRLTVLAVLGTVLVAPAGAQVPRRPREEQVAALPRFMVANPYVTASADSAAAVQVGGGMRERMTKITDGDYNVLTQDQMNEALRQYGYPANAILSPTLAVTLAKSVQAKVLVSSTMTKTGSQYTLQGRLAGVNDEAGSVATMAQDALSLTDLGARVADKLEPAYKSLNEAKSCIDQRATKPDKAAEAANKALRQYPGNGLAEYCLAQIALAKKDTKEAIKHFQAAAKADPLSLAAWSNLAEQYQAQNDTANVLATFRELLKVAPTNQKLREQAFKYFLNANKPDIAKEIADSGIRNDPYNSDFYDLKSNACLFLSDFKCAIDALEQGYAIDSTKADTLFFTKITVAAQQQPDTARLLKWAKIANKKYPTNVTLLQSLGKAYSLSGQLDSSAAVAQRLVQANPGDVSPALEAAQAMINAKRPKDALPLIQLAAQKGDATAKENVAALLYQAAAPLLQDTPPDYAGAADLLRSAVGYANPQGKVYPAANYLLGLATLLQVPQVDPQAEKQKSCDLAKQEAALLDEAEKALTAGQSANPDVATRNLGIIAKYKPRAASMIKAYCK